MFVFCAHIPGSVSTKSISHKYHTSSMTDNSCFCLRKRCITKYESDNLIQVDQDFSLFIRSFDTENNFVPPVWLSYYQWNLTLSLQLKSQKQVIWVKLYGGRKVYEGCPILSNRDYKRPVWLVCFLQLMQFIIRFVHLVQIDKQALWVDTSWQYWICVGFLNKGCQQICQPKNTVHDHHLDKGFCNNFIFASLKIKRICSKL